MNKKLILTLLLLLNIIFSFSQTSLTLLNSYEIDEDIPEPSGLTFDKANNQLFTVSDTKDVFRMSITGDLLEIFEFEGDLEGVTMFNEPNTLLVAIEDGYELVEYNYETGSTTTHEMEYENRDDPAGGIEGVAYNPVTGEVYFVNEKDPIALIVADDDFNVTDEYVLDFSDDLSALTYVEETNHLWMGSDNSSSVYKCEVNGTVLQSYLLTTDGSEDGDLLGKLEGIAIDYDNQLFYLVTDEGRRLYVYQMSEPVNPDCNGVSNGLAFIDNCGVCSGGNTGVEVDACFSCELAVATSEDEDNVAVNVLDMNPDTRWSAFGVGESIDICLGDTLNLSEVSLAFFRGNERTTTVDIETSLDGVIWTSVITDYESNGMTLGLETIVLGNIEAWKIRVVGKGNSESEWNSITRVEWTESNVTGTDDFMIKNKVSIYPNPVNDVLKIRGLSDSTTWGVFNMQGELLSKGSSDFVHTSQFKEGVYLLELSSGETIKFIK